MTEPLDLMQKIIDKKQKEYEELFRDLERKVLNLLYTYCRNQNGGGVPKVMHLLCNLLGQQIVIFKTLNKDFYQTQEQLEKLIADTFEMISESIRKHQEILSDLKTSENDRPNP